MSYEIINSTLETWSSSYTGPKFHAVLCDPPYGLRFMGQDWDTVSAKEWGHALLPHLYPGALCLMFGGTRTWHKLATGMEDAGFDIWDTLMWLYGQGFPKAQDISKLIDKHNGDTRVVIGKDQWFASASNTRDKYNGYSGEDTRDITAPGSELSSPWSGYKTCALKPAWEPILAFRVPTKQTYAELAMGYGSGTLNIDGTRISTNDNLNGGAYSQGKQNDGEWGTMHAFTGTQYTQPVGRYPANLLLNENSAALLDEQSGASRFFYCAKASTTERNIGCEQITLRQRDLSRTNMQPSMNDGEGNPYNRGVILKRNSHPTVKPLALIEYLAKLILPPDSVKPRLLVPFSGSGSEMIGALKAGWDEVTGIEQDADNGYCQIAQARLAHHIKEINARP